MILTSVYVAIALLAFMSLAVWLYLRHSVMTVYEFEKWEALLAILMIALLVVSIVATALLVSCLIQGVPLP